MVSLLLVLAIVRAYIIAAMLGGAVPRTVNGLALVLRQDTYHRTVPGVRACKGWHWLTLNSESVSAGLLQLVSRRCRQSGRPHQRFIGPQEDVDVDLVDAFDCKVDKPLEVVR